jgi:hypothetical protein
MSLTDKKEGIDKNACAFSRVIERLIGPENVVSAISLFILILFVKLLQVFQAGASIRILLTYLFPGLLLLVTIGDRYLPGIHFRRLAISSRQRR